MNTGGNGGGVSGGLGGVSRTGDCLPMTIISMRSEDRVTVVGGQTLTLTEDLHCKRLVLGPGAKVKRNGFSIVCGEQPVLAHGAVIEP